MSSANGKEKRPWRLKIEAAGLRIGSKAAKVGGKAAVGLALAGFGVFVVVALWAFAWVTVVVFADCEWTKAAAEWVPWSWRPVDVPGEYWINAKNRFIGMAAFGGGVTAASIAVQLLITACKVGQKGLLALGAKADEQGKAAAAELAARKLEGEMLDEMAPAKAPKRDLRL